MSPGAQPARTISPGVLEYLLEQICQAYGVGAFRAQTTISVGYQDFNVVLTTTQGKYFVKFFARQRTPEYVDRHIAIIKQVLAAGIQHPLLYQSVQGYLYKADSPTGAVMACVYQWLDGFTFFDLQIDPTDAELQLLARQAAAISLIDIKPYPVYDRWSCSNFLTEYQAKMQYLDEPDRVAIEGLAAQLKGYDFSNLPHSFVHGDLVRTNVMRGRNGQVYILDFGSANCYPRIQEIAVLLSDLGFDRDNPGRRPGLYRQVLREYQRIAPLQQQELALLPLYTRVAHAMNVISASYEKSANHNHSQENDFWLGSGRQGLLQHPEFFADLP